MHFSKESQGSDLWAGRFNGFLSCRCVIKGTRREFVSARNPSTFGSKAILKKLLFPV